MIALEHLVCVLAACLREREWERAREREKGREGGREGEREGIDKAWRCFSFLTVSGCWVRNQRCIPGGMCGVWLSLQMTSVNRSNKVEVTHEHLQDLS